MQDALLHALVEHGDGLAILGLGSLHVALGESLAQGPQAGAHAAAVGAVDFSARNGLAGALERRNMVCHCSSLIFEPCLPVHGSKPRSGEMMRGQNATRSASLAIS